MNLVVEVRFPHRQYQATPWDAAANSGAVEWPPSPWRLCRSLLSIWHVKHPELPEESVKRVIDTVAMPPVYTVPETRHGHTRHYMPKREHQTGVRQGETSLTLASYVSVPPNQPLIIEWSQANLSEADHDVAARLFGSLGYLGRAESVCNAVVVNTALSTPDTDQMEQWIPSETGSQRLLCPEPGATLKQLELSPTQMRKQRQLVPSGSRWVNYEVKATATKPSPVRLSARRSDLCGIHAIRWHLHSRAPFLKGNGVLATEQLRLACLHYMFSGKKGDPSEHDRYLLSGHDDDRDTRRGLPHDHAHWLWTVAEDNRTISDLILWIPDAEGLSLEVASRLSRSFPLTAHHWAPQGWVKSDLQFIGAGGHEIIADLGGNAGGSRTGSSEPCTTWESETPYLVARHWRERRDPEALLREDIEHQLRYYFPDDPPELIGDLRRRAVVDSGELYRTYRWSQSMREAKPINWLEITLSKPVPGPLTLGWLSHFGFGRFVPKDTSSQ